MFEHLAHNSCGERDALVAALSTIPLAGVALAALARRLRTWWRR